MVISPLSLQIFVVFSLFSVFVQRRERRWAERGGMKEVRRWDEGGEAMVVEFRCSRARVRVLCIFDELRRNLSYGVAFV